MTTEYRLTAIGDDGLEKDVGILGALKIPPQSILVLSVDPAMPDSDVHRLRADWYKMIENYGDWKDIPVIVMRADDLRFACLTLVETTE